MSTSIIVSRDSLQSMLDTSDTTKVMHIVGRALIALLKRQTEVEQSNNSTVEHNGIGFAGCDARSGSITAKYYIKHNRLDQWMVDKWLKQGKNNYSRLAKYHSQLNEIAIEKSKK
jgi:beta-galactosidase GanA